MNKSEISKYLKFLKIKTKYIPKLRKCEICNSKNTKILQKKISWNNNKFGVLPVHCCLKCGFVFQNPRFSKKFYLEYYQNLYRNITLKGLKPSKKYLNDMKIRGQKLYKFLKPHLPRRGSMLDVGSSVGLFLLPFLKNGWKCMANDPVESFVNYGRKKYRLPVEFMQSENMKLKKNSLDLIIIMGSLEHCYDPNKVLKLCAEGIKKNGLLVLECRGDPQGKIKDFFNQSHHRYFFGNTLELIMMKHGWEPYLTTKYPICGPTREGGYFSFGKFKGKRIINKFKKTIDYGKKETFESIKFKLKYFDYLAHLK
jgi:2-polyprenyl-3-methyl-5-hydroxy-6-metoxy-1,4-benzoquinol methylase